MFPAATLGDFHLITFATTTVKIREETGFWHGQYIGANGTDREHRSDAREQAEKLPSVVLRGAGVLTGEAAL